MVKKDDITPSSLMLPQEEATLEVLLYSVEFDVKSSTLDEIFSDFSGSLGNNANLIYDNEVISAE